MRSTLLRHAFRRSLSTAATRYRGPSFAFDIDGVLQRGGRSLPPARSALHLLYDPSADRWRAPVAFLTNGGGHTESRRAAHLAAQFDLPICASQVVLAHTPMRGYADRYNALRDAVVAVVGPPECAHVAREYGFERVVTVETLAQAVPATAPFATFDHLAPLSARDAELARMRVAAVFVMADSADWGRDMQLLVDILSSDGSAARTPCAEQTVDVFFSNPDVTFPNEFHIPRLAGGSFRVALEAVYERVAQRKLRAVQFGKPHAPNYELAENVLRTQAGRMGFCEQSDLSVVYAVGDNPLSDVRGANLRGAPWVSVLVRTGNFQGDNDECDPAHVVVDDAHAAVQHALERHPENVLPRVAVD